MGGSPAAQAGRPAAHGCRVPAPLRAAGPSHTMVSERSARWTSHTKSAVDWLLRGAIA
jgi:hypothetical protein